MRGDLKVAQDNVEAMDVRARPSDAMYRRVCRARGVLWRSRGRWCAAGYRREPPTHAHPSHRANSHRCCSAPRQEENRELKQKLVEALDASARYAARATAVRLPVCQSASLPVCQSATSLLPALGAVHSTRISDIQVTRGPPCWQRRCSAAPRCSDLCVALCAVSIRRLRPVPKLDLVPEGGTGSPTAADVRRLMAENEALKAKVKEQEQEIENLEVRAYSPLHASLRLATRATVPTTGQLPCQCVGRKANSALRGIGPPGPNSY